MYICIIHMYIYNMHTFIYMYIYAHMCIYIEQQICNLTRVKLHALLFQVVFHYIERPLTRWSGKESRKGWLLLGVINSLVI